MSHGPHHHLEHADHAAHASRDEFDKRVTISIAIVAAVLAAVTMLGHRAHNETLEMQGEALVAQSEAAIQHNEATNKWSQYQSSNIRDHMYHSLLELSVALPGKNGDQDVLAEARARWLKQREKYEKNLEHIKEEAEEHVKEGQELEHHAKEMLSESHLAHAKTMRFDLGELGLQMGVVLCSMAILTKLRTFWLIGMLCSAAGLVLALTGVLGVFLGGGPH